MVACMISGNGFYLTSVVTRHRAEEPLKLLSGGYVDLRLATEFEASRAKKESCSAGEERFFDGWCSVISARLFLLIHLLTVPSLDSLKRG